MINQEEYEKIKLLPDYDWNWIAREKTGRILSFTNKPTKTDEVWKDKQTYLWFNYKDSQLFQFIQWEDEEPYNIAELIEEYEYSAEHVSHVLNTRMKALVKVWGESEETEVKKDIEWLKEEIGELPCVDTVFNSDCSSYIDSAVPVMTVYDLIDKLDEPEVLSQEQSINMVLDDLKEHIKEQQSLSQNVGMAHTPSANDTYSRKYDFVLECIDEYKPSEDLQSLLVPKQELPVVPRFVAEWIKEMKQDERPLYSAMSSLMNKTNHEWAIWKTTNKNFSEIVAQAWLDGFTVEEEQKYYALVKGHELIKGRGNWVPKYWNLYTTDGDMHISDRDTVHDKYLTEASKSEWGKLGINDSNADFVKVEEVEEW